MVDIISEKEEPVRKRARRKDNRRTSRRDSQQPLASESIVREASEPMIGVQTDVGEENFQCDTEFMTMNRSGLVVEGGGVYKVTDTPVVVGIESVSKDLASGTLIVDNKVLDDVKISAPVNRLSSVASSLCKKDSAYMRKFSILCNGDKLQMAPASVRLSVRKTLLAKSLRKEVQSSLRLTSFRKSFCLGVLSPEFDMSIFNFKDVLKVEYSYAKQNLSCLDSLLGEGWDLQSPNGQCNFVTKLTLKIKDMQLFGKVFTAKCRETLPKNYRSFLSEYDVGPTESGLSEVIAMV